jgi:hypothetical protein
MPGPNDLLGASLGNTDNRGEFWVSHAEIPELLERCRSMVQGFLAGNLKRAYFSVRVARHLNEGASSSRLVVPLGRPLHFVPPTFDPIA